VFGGSEQVFSFEIVNGDGALARVTWVFSAKNRTIARGEQSWDQNAGRVPVRLAVPPVRDGVIFPAELKLEVFGPGNDPVARYVKPLWIFPNDPFAGRTAWLAEQRIALFDPVGHTREVLVEAGVPLRESHRLAVLDEVREGLLLVGEGVSFREHRGLAESLLRRAAAGVAVLCLAPADGQNTTSPAFDGLQFQACPNRNQLTVPGGELAEPLAGQQHVGFSAATRGVVDDRKAQLAAEQRQLGFGRRIDRPLTDVALGHLDRHGRTWSLAKKQSTWADAYSARYSMIRASRNRGAGPASQ